jgi:hypothetical protein
MFGRTQTYKAIIAASTVCFFGISTRALRPPKRWPEGVIS